MKTSILSLLLFLSFGSASATEWEIDPWRTFDEAYDALEIQEGDTVKFLFGAFHDVYKFRNKGAFENCDFTRADKVCDRGASPCVISDLDDDGKFHFFGCSIGTHCSNGNMKLEIIVSKDESDSDSGD
jgi:hypothetical protein